MDVQNFETWSDKIDDSNELGCSNEIDGSGELIDGSGEID